MTTTQRWTLAVVCAATAMLMLDIAVVNTALSRHRRRPRHRPRAACSGSSTPTRSRSPRVVLTAGSLADRFGRRRLFAIGLVALHRSPRSRARRRSDIAMLNAARAVQGVGAAIMFAVSLALLANAFPRRRGARRGARRLRRDDRRARSPSARSSAARSPAASTGAGSSSSTCRSASLCLAITRALRRGVARPERAAASTGPARSRSTAGLFLLVLALLRGNEDGWGSAPIVAELAGAVVAARRVRRDRGARQASRCSRSASSATARSPARRSRAFAISASFFAVFLYTTLYLQQILGLSAIEAGLVYLPGTMIMFVVSGATAQLVREGLGAAR